MVDRTRRLLTRRSTGVSPLGAQVVPGAFRNENPTSSIKAICAPKRRAFLKSAANPRAAKPPPTPHPAHERSLPALEHSTPTHQVAAIDSSRCSALRTSDKSLRRYESASSDRYRTQRLARRHAKPTAPLATAPRLGTKDGPYERDDAKRIHHRSAVAAPIGSRFGGSRLIDARSRT